MSKIPYSLLIAQQLQITAQQNMQRSELVKSNTAAEKYTWWWHRFK